MTVIFLETERRVGGYFQLGKKKKQEKVKKRLVFMCDLTVIWKGIGRFEIQRESELRKQHADFWKTSRLREKIQRYSRPSL